MRLFHRSMGEGPPLLILHGLFGSSDNWQTHARVFAQTHTVYLIDQRNHGHSPHAAQINYDVMAHDLFELVADLGLRDIRFIGHSMGGKTIMRFAQQYGFLIDRMVVADMGMKAYPPHHEQVFQGLFAVDASHCPTRKMAEERLSNFISDQGTLQFLLKNLYWKEPKGTVMLYRADGRLLLRTEGTKGEECTRIPQGEILFWKYCNGQKQKRGKVLE